MDFFPRPTILFKALRQLGFRSLSLSALYRAGLKTGHYRRMTPIKRQEPTLDPGSFALHPIFDLPSCAQLLAILGQEGKASLVQEAGEILNGKFRIFGGEPVPLQLTFNAPLQHWTEYESDKRRIPGLASLPIPDVKFVLEPARFGWAFTLGRAYHVTQDDGYAAAFWNHFETFDTANPANLGPHWMSAQEVALRLMALVWAAQVFGTAPSSSPARGERLARSIAEHAQRLPPTLVRARSQNNQALVLEAAALFTAGHALPGHPRADRWRALGWSWLNRALREQIGSYGEYIQHSLNHHRLMLQSVLWVDAILRTGGRGAGYQRRWPAQTLEALMRASHWLFSMIDSGSGRTPNLGDNDGALFLPLGASPFNDFRPTAQAAARAFLRNGLPAGAWDELSSWLGLSPTEHVAGSDLYLSDNLRAKNSWAYLRASRFKSGLTHMDQLHLDLWWRGLNVAQDAGTYLHNAEAPWDNPLVASRVHNTLTVDGRDQMTRGGRFLTLDWFPAYSKSEIPLDERVLQRVTAWHTGHHGLRHERTVTVFTDERWLVEDRLTARRTHVHRLHWLLPDWDWRIKEGESVTGLELLSPHGPVSLRITAASPFMTSRPAITLIRAGELIHRTGQAQAFEGWVSPTYGVKLPALSLAVEVTCPGPVTFTTEFIFPK